MKNHTTRLLNFLNPSNLKKYDGEFPKRYFKDCLDYMGITQEEFFETIEKFRPPHIWKKVNGEWKLKKAVWHKDNT